MAASFPGAIKTFTTKTAGAGILSEHVNAIQEEVVAIETAIGVNPAKWTFLAEPLTSTSWDGDAHSTEAKTLIDLSAVFGVPAGVKAVMFAGCYIRDSASAANDCWLILGPTNTNLVGNAVTCPSVNDRPGRFNFIVPCDANGDIYYQCAASGVGTLDIFLQIWGYYL